MKPETQRLLKLVTLILIVTLFRLYTAFYPNTLANFSSVAAVAIFSAILFRQSWFSIVPVCSVFLTDVVLAQTLYKQYSNGLLYDGWYYTYLAIVLMALAARPFRRSFSPIIFLPVSVIAVIIHWVVTDFGVWYGSSFYPQNLQGFTTCLLAAIPFEIRLFAGTIFYGGIMFFATGVLPVKQKQAYKTFQLKTRTNG